MSKPSSLLTSALTLGLTLAAAGSAMASVIPWDLSSFADASVDSGDTINFGTGGTLTFSNVVGGDAGSSGTVDVDGIFFGPMRGVTAPFFQVGVQSVDLTFNQSVQILSYTVSFAATPVPTLGTFTLDGANGTSGANDGTIVSANIPFNSGGISVFEAGQAYTLTADVIQAPTQARANFFQIQSIEVGPAPDLTPIPLPSSVLFLASALGGMVIWRRRRTAA